MDSALIISSSAKSVEFLTEMLNQSNINHIDVAFSANETRKQLSKNNYDLCVINSPLTDEFGENLACDIASSGTAQVIMLVKAEAYEEISNKVEDFGVVIISKPLNKSLFLNALKISNATFKKMQIIQKENQKLIQKISDIRIIDRAKCILVSHLAITEPEAHKYIEKQAMDMRITRRAVAEEILKTYEN